MRFLPPTWSRNDTTAPGVFELGRAQRNRVSTPEDFLAAERERSDLLGARTEILFHQLYDWIAATLAAAFPVCLEISGEDRRILAAIAQQAQLDLADTDDHSVEAAADQIVWRNAARAAALVLFDQLAGELAGLDRQSDVDTSVRWTDSEWVDRVVTDRRFNSSRFSRASSLVGEEVPLALRVAAKAVTEWERFQAPGEHLRYRGVSLFLLANRGSNQLQALKAESATIAYLEGELAGQNDRFLIFKPDVMIMAVGSRLYFDDSHNDGVVTVAAGDAEAIAPRPYRFSVNVHSAKPVTVRHEHQSGPVSTLSFTSSDDQATVALPRSEVQPLSDDSFLLQADVQHQLPR
jgi:hypothetical protein